MQPMQGLKLVAEEITRKLAAGELGNHAPNTLSGSIPSRMMSASLARSKPHPAESAPPAVVARRAAISREIVKRYRFDKMLDPLSDRMLAATVKSYDDLFVRAGVPTDRLRDLYSEAMLTHPPGRWLTVTDFLTAWQRIVESMAGHADDVVRGAQCKQCGGTGRVWKFRPFDWRNPNMGDWVEVDCLYGCLKIVALVRQDENMPSAHEVV